VCVHGAAVLTLKFSVRPLDIKGPPQHWLLGNAMDALKFQKEEKTNDFLLLGCELYGKYAQVSVPIDLIAADLWGLLMCL
jgi:hypothetical protein